LIETDSPYLAPVPFRGKRNEPSYVKFVAEKIAEIKQISVSEVEKITTENAKRLFRLPVA
jgi:TatD DNase family protein